MNYRQARELKDEDGKGRGLWHYTNMNDSRIWPEGYCADGCPGHPTPEGAEEHYREYLLATADFQGRIANAQRKCVHPGCDAWTQRNAQVGPGRLETYMLCDLHCNRNGLEKVMARPCMSVSSY